MTPRRALAGAVLALAAVGPGAMGAGCSDLGPFAIRYGFADDDRCPRAARCQSFGMACGATLLFRVVDLEAGDPTTGELLFDRCVEVLPATSLCELDDADLGGLSVPAHRVRIEVAAWRPEALDATAPVGCPPSDRVFTLTGEVRADFDPRPAFAGTTVFDAGSAASVALVPLACLDPAQLAEAECARTGRTLVTTLVADVETSLSVTEQQAAGLAVEVAQPRAQGDGAGGTYYEIVSSDTIDLTLQPGPSPTFVVQTDAVLGASVCTRVEEDVAQSTAAVVCETVEAGADPLVTRGVLVGTPVLDDVLVALGASGFPSDGLLLGRVVDHTGAPLAGVAVTPAVGQVAYVSGDRGSIGGVATSSSGYFVASDVPFGTTLTATHIGDGRRQQGNPRAGLVRGQLTVVIISMEPP